MLVNIAPDADFAEELAKDLGLNIASGVTPDDTNDDSVIVADLEQDMASEHEDVIQAGIANHSTIVLRNSKSGTMARFALFGIDAETVVLKAREKGRVQDMVVFGVQDGPAAEADPGMDETGDAPERAPASSTRTEPEPRKSAAVQEAPIEEFVKEQVSESQEICNTIKSLNQRRTLTMGVRAARVVNINASQASGTVSFSEKTWHPNNARKGVAKIFGAFDVELAAVVEPVKSKVIKITSRGTAVSATPLAADADQNRAWFTQHGLVMVYPGNKYTFDMNAIALPNGWIRRAISPETPNNTSTYTKTTGWTIGGKVGGKVAEKPEATAELSASYSQSSSETTQIQDFRVKNESSAAISKWKYEYTTVTDNWKAMCYQDFAKWGRIKPIAQLSKSTMFLQNESVYQAPANATGSQRFCFYIGQQAAQLSESAHSIWSHSYHVRYKADGIWQSVDINLGMVRHPD